MILDNNGNPSSTAASAIKLPEVSDTKPEPTERRNYKPGPGRVTVLRELASDHYLKDDVVDIAKHAAVVKSENAFAILATVARVGDRLPGGIEPWFKKGDRVTIIPSMFDEINIAPGMHVFCGPFSAVTGIFEDEEEEDKPAVLVTGAQIAAALRESARETRASLDEQWRLNGESSQQDEDCPECASRPPSDDADRF